MGGILMTDKEFQELVVNQLQILTEGQQALNDKVNNLDANQVRMENELTDKVDKLDNKVDKLDDKVNELDDKVNKLDDKVNKLDNKVDKLDAKVDKLDANQIRMENELTEKIRGLYDFREVQNDVNERIISTLERLEAKIDVLQLETAHLRRVK